MYILIHSSTTTDNYSIIHTLERVLQLSCTTLPNGLPLSQDYRSEHAEKIPTGGRCCQVVGGRCGRFDCRGSKCTRHTRRQRSRIVQCVTCRAHAHDGTGQRCVRKGQREQTQRYRPSHSGPPRTYFGSRRSRCMALEMKSLPPDWFRDPRKHRRCPILRPGRTKKMSL